MSEAKPTPLTEPLDLSEITHGHVGVKNRHGTVARCGGPSACMHCRLEQEVLMLWQVVIGGMSRPVGDISDLGAALRIVRAVTRFVEDAEAAYAASARSAGEMFVDAPPAEQPTEETDAMADEAADRLTSQDEDDEEEEAEDTALWAECENCGTSFYVEWGVTFTEDTDPSFCPFCGVELEAPDEPQPEEDDCCDCGYVFEADDVACPYCGAPAPGYSDVAPQAGEACDNAQASTSSPGPEDEDDDDWMEC